MDFFRFSITPEAVAFIQRVLLSDPKEDLVLSIAPETEARRVEVGSEPISDVLNRVVEDLEGATVGDPGKLQFRWVIGASRRERFPSDDILVCDGIPCFIPKQMKEMLNGRSLTVVEDELRFTPDLPKARS